MVEQRAAGSPVKDQTWTDLTVEQIRERLMEKDLYVCSDVVRALLDEEGYGLRQIQKYLDYVKHDRYLDGYVTILQDNPMPSVTGRVCYHPCETACNRAAHDEPIGTVEIAVSRAN